MQSPGNLRRERILGHLRTGNESLPDDVVIRWRGQAS
jgi:hypothetical protein